MVKVEVSAKIALPIDEYWAHRITQEFLDAETQVLKNASKVISATKTDEKGRVTHHQMKTKPDLSTVPNMLMGMLPEEGIVYTDEIEYIFDDPQTSYVCKTRTTPNIAQDTCNITSIMRVIPDPENPTNACIQTLSLDVNVGLWMVGGAVESLIANGVRDGYKKLPQILNAYLAAIAPAPASAPAAERQVSVGSDSDYASLSEADTGSLEDLHKHGVKREHSAPNSPAMQKAALGKTGSGGLKGMLFGANKKQHLSASTQSLETLH